MANSLVHPESLVLTIDAVNEAMFDGVKISRADARQTAAWVASRAPGGAGKIVGGSYRGMPALTEYDHKNKGSLFTGEKMTSWAGLACKMGFEACRAIILLDDSGKETQAALSRAVSWMQVLAKAPATDPNRGRYCCMSCSAAYWRLLSLDPIKGSPRLLSAGLQWLKNARSGDGRWRGFPFYYTLLSLLDAHTPQSRVELQYAAPVCERLLRRPARDEKFPLRRRQVMQRVLESV